MMDDARVAGMEIDRGHDLVFGDVDRDHEVLENVAAVGRDGKRFRHPNDKIGGPEPPARGERRKRRLVGRVARLAASFGPGRDRLDLLLCHPAIAEEWMSIAGGRHPGRHDPGSNRLHDHRGVGRHLRGRREGEGGNFPGPVTRHAAGMDDRRDIPGIRDGGFQRRLSGDFQSASHWRDERFCRGCSSSDSPDRIGKPALGDGRPPAADRFVRIVDRAPVGDAATGIDHKHLRHMGGTEAAAERLTAFPDDREGEGPLLKTGDRLVAGHRLVGDNGEEPHRRSVRACGSGHLVGDFFQPRQRAV